MAPFISALDPEAAKAKLFKDILPGNNKYNKVVPQILGNQADKISGTANAMLDLGYEEVNLNLGCPYPMVTKKNRGAGLLRDLDYLDKMLDSVFSSIKTRLSLKTRIGFERPDEIIALAEIFNRYPASEIIIHPRVASQMYAGKASVDSFVRSMDILRHKLVYNGDICSPEYFHDIKARLPKIERWMLGRGAISNPFLPEMIKSSSLFPDDAEERFFRFHDELYSAYREKFHGPAHLIDRMKSFWRYFSISVNQGEDIRKKINKLRTEKNYLEEMENLKKRGITFMIIPSPLHLK